MTVIIDDRDAEKIAHILSIFAADSPSSEHVAREYAERLCLSIEGDGPDFDEDTVLGQAMDEYDNVYDVESPRGTFVDRDLGLMIAARPSGGAIVGLDDPDPIRRPNARIIDGGDAGAEIYSTREMSDGSLRPVMGSEQPLRQRLAAIEDGIRDVEEDAGSARADTKDKATSVTISERVRRLERNAFGNTMGTDK